MTPTPSDYAFACLAIWSLFGAVIVGGILDLTHSPSRRQMAVLILFGGPLMWLIVGADWVWRALGDDKPIGLDTPTTLR